MILFDFPGNNYMGCDHALQVCIIFMPKKLLMENHHSICLYSPTIPINKCVD